MAKKGRKQRRSRAPNQALGSIMLAAFFFVGMLQFVQSGILQDLYFNISLSVTNALYAILDSYITKITATIVVIAITANIIRLYVPQKRIKQTAIEDEMIDVQEVPHKERVQKKIMEGEKGERRWEMMMSLKNNPDFETFIGLLFVENQGYDKFERTPPTNDGGIDAILYKGGEKYVVQVKKYKEGTIGGPEINKILGAAQVAKSPNAIFVTTSDYTKQAKEHALISNVDLYDKNRLKFAIQSLSNEQFKNLIIAAQS